MTYIYRISMIFVPCCSAIELHENHRNPMNIRHVEVVKTLSHISFDGSLHTDTIVPLSPPVGLGPRRPGTRTCVAARARLSAPRTRIEHPLDALQKPRDGSGVLLQNAAALENATARK